MTDRRFSPVQVWSHRGRVDSSPSLVDNTADAISNAFGSGADGVELDTWLCGDGVFVLTHDRETPAGLVDRCPVGALGELDRLDEVLALPGRGSLNIELKVPPDSSPAEQARLGVELAAYLQQSSALTGADRTSVVVSSFCEVATREMLDAGVGMRIGHLCLQVPAERTLEDLAGYGYWGIHFLATPESVDKVAAIHAAGLAAVAWTVNDPGLAGRLVDAGVDVIITDVPLAVKAAVTTAP